MNPVDYKIWAVMQERVYEKRVNDVDELCQRLFRVTTHLENLEKSGNSKVVREKSGGVKSAEI